MTTAEAAHELHARLSPCRLCPRECGIDRNAGEIGFCGIGADAVVAATCPHFGEEPPLVGRGGSGTIFFAGCSLGCVFCQNDDISHGRAGREITVDALAGMMLDLQRLGCHNINWVTPTHQIHAIIDALERARGRGLALPTVYNSGGYESVEILRLLEGQVDIYMPDAKFAVNARGERYCAAADYGDVMRVSIREMHRQVGDLEIRDGIAGRGLLVRHLVMPGMVEESRAILDFLAHDVSPNTYVNVMPQYRPVYRACEYPEIARRPSQAEFEAVCSHAHQLGLRTCP